VAGTLIPQDKEGNGRIILHEENGNFIFEESRTFRSNQLGNEDSLQKQSKSNNYLDKSLLYRIK
jgi:hypothetical protein